MSFAKDILRSLTSSPDDKFDGALQILDVITELVADRLGAGICATLYCKKGDSEFSLLSITDTVGIETASLSQIESLVNANKANADFFGRYIDISSDTLDGFEHCKALVNAKLDLMYAFEFDSANGDSATIVAFIEQSENTSTVSADRVCKLAAQQLRVIFKFVDMAIQERTLKSFVRVVLKLSTLRFAGATVGQTLERIGRMAADLVGVGTVQTLNREEYPDEFAREFARLESEGNLVCSFVTDVEVTDPAIESKTGVDKDNSGNDSDSSFSLIAGLTSEGVYLTTLETGSNARWALRLTPPPFGEFAEQDLELLRLFASYAAITLSNHNFAQRQKRVNDDLRAAQDRLVEAESLAAIGDMASGLAHDFNNLIGSVIGRIEILKTKVTDPDLLADLAEIEKLSAEGAERMRRLQEFAMSAKSTNHAPIDLAAFYNTYRTENRSWIVYAQRKSVSVSFVSLTMDSVMISGKSADIELMLDNLITNAIDATPSGGEVKVEFVLEKNRVCLIVSDSGSGVPDNIKHKIFNPFFTTKASTKGAGLGLSVAHGIAVRHGGSISVGSSRDAIGSTFSAAFPLAKKLPTDKIIVPADAPITRKLRIMVVDDDPQIRDVLRDMLVLIDQNADVFEDAEHALANFAKGKYDMVITDLGMPGLSGLELTVKLKEIEPDIPVAMVTGWGAQLNEEEILSHGIFKLVSKPFYLKDIKSLINTTLEARA